LPWRARVPHLFQRGIIRPAEHRDVISRKAFLRKVYLSHYSDIIAVENKVSDRNGKSLELGSGGGFLKSILPEVITSEAQATPGVDRLEDACKLSFKDGELRAIYMTGVLHHIGKPREFFREASRCLQDGGYLVMMEPHMSAFGRFFFKVLHHEANDMLTHRWEFPQTGLLSDANTALPYIIFDRDFEVFRKEFPELQLESRKFHTFLEYALSGGVGFRFSTPGWLYEPVHFVERCLSPFMRKYLGTMQTITLVKRQTVK